MESDKRYIELVGSKLIYSANKRLNIYDLVTNQIDSWDMEEKQ